MASLLIAVRSKELAAALAETLTEHKVHICHTGADALALLETLRPDSFLVELSLPILSGLSVLQKTHVKPTVILALTDLITESVLQAAVHAGVQDLLLLPCPVRQIAAHLKALIQKAPAPEV